MEQAKKLVTDGQQPKSSEINYQVCQLFTLITRLKKKHLFQSLLNEFTFIQSKLDEVKYQIQTSATSAGNASPKVGTNQQPFDEVLSLDEQKELEKKVKFSFSILPSYSFYLAINRSFGYIF